jgi:hypothetical protein
MPSDSAIAFRSNPALSSYSICQTYSRFERRLLTPACSIFAMNFLLNLPSASANAFSASKLGSTWGTRSRPAPCTATRRPGCSAGMQCTSLNESSAQKADVRCKWHNLVLLLQCEATCAQCVLTSDEPADRHTRVCQEVATHKGGCTGEHKTPWKLPWHKTVSCAVQDPDLSLLGAAQLAANQRTVKQAAC